MKSTRRVASYILVLSALTLDGAHAAFEYSVQCLPDGAQVEPPLSHFPFSMGLMVASDNRSRSVAVNFAWNSLGLLERGFGLEFKTYQYNYDDAQATGKGPAYVTGPSGYFSCDLPGCYIDSDFASEKNGVGEYREPQVGFGVSPESAGLINKHGLYTASTRATAGRGNSSLMKVRLHVTKAVAPPLGTWGIFLCRDIPALNALNYKQGVYAPACVQFDFSKEKTSACIP